MTLTGKFWRVVFALTIVSTGAAQTSVPADPPLQPTPLLGPAVPQVTPPTGVILPGNNSVTANIIQVQNQIDKSAQAAGNLNSEPSTFDFYLEQYDHFHSTPYLFIIGLPLGQVLASPIYKATLWAAVLLFLALSIGSRLRPGATGPQELDFFANLFLKLAAVTLLLSAPDLIYATGMTIMNSGENFVKGLQAISDQTPDGVTSRVADVLSHSGTFDLELNATRERAIRNGLADRQGIFSKFTEPALQTASADYWACFFNQYAAAQQTAFSNGQNYPPVPRVGQAPVEEILGRVITLYNSLALDSAAVDANSTSVVGFSLDWQFKDYAAKRTSFTIAPLANRIQQTTQDIYSALKQTGSTPDGLSARQTLLQQYEKTVRAATSNWVDAEYIDGFAESLSGIDPLVNVVRDVGSWTKRGALSVARNLRLPGFLDGLNWFLNLGVHILQYTLVPMLAFAACFCFRVLMELNLLGLMCLAPLWFLESTAKAFRGAVWTLGVCVVTLPCYQFFQLLLDLLFGALSHLITTGSLLFLAQPELLPEAIVTIMFGLTVGYFVAVVILVFKAPKMVHALLNGGNWAAQILGIAARGVVTSAIASAIGFNTARTAFGRGNFLPGADLGKAGRKLGQGRPLPPIFSATRRKVWLKSAHETANFGKYLLRNGGSSVQGGLSYLKARKSKHHQLGATADERRQEKHLEKRHEELLAALRASQR